MKHALLLGLLSLSLSASAETIVGKLERTPEGKFLLKTQSEVVDLGFKNGTENHIDSFLGYSTYLRVSGERQGTSFIVHRTPTIQSGASRLSGILTITSSAVYIEQQQVVFEEAAAVNGTAFDAQSLRSFADRQVIANGTYEDGEFKVSALVPAYLYSAQALNGGLKPREEFLADPMAFAAKTINKNEYSQKGTSFRGTLMGEGEPRPGDHALVITLSGRQGDDLGAANGHFAIGMARVGEDLSLDMEVHNYYPPKNEKQIIPGYIDYVDYFGHLTAGQANYRPTYTIVVYGEERERLLKMRASMDEEFANLRRGEDNFSIGHNCTTVSVHGLESIGVVGRQQRFPRKIFDPKNVLKLNPLYYTGDLQKISGQLSFSLGKNQAYYVPRPAFDSLLKNLKWLLRKERLNGQRVDYIFQAQTPSARAQGGTAANGFLESLKIRMKAQEHEKRPMSAEAIKKILDSVN